MGMLYCKFCNRGCDANCFDSHRTRYYCHDSRCPGSEPRGSDRGRRSSSTLRPEPPSRSSSTLRPELSRSSSKRYSSSRSSSSVRRTPERRESISRTSTPVSGMCYSRDARTGERFSYPCNPNEDRDHMRICAKYPPPKRGFRYGYDNDGVVVSFSVSREADDYCDRADMDYRRERPERPPSRSASYRGGGDPGIERPHSRSASYRGGGDAGTPKRSYSTRGRDFDDRGGGLGRSYSTRDTRPRDMDQGGGGGLGRRPSMSRRHQSARDEYAYAGSGGRSYESSRPRYPPGYMNQNYGSWSGRHEPSAGMGSSLRPEAAEEPKRKIVTPEEVDWEIETVID
ncbi:hypothetical protein PG993_011635 [Apiospora rasikravindrae]|uniref:Uncharacterized protein n=1 Tax=Apiospora rasikravindrae TaxID=990691 RepID=A0ABR1S2F2_9PEZI